MAKMPKTGQKPIFCSTRPQNPPFGFLNLRTLDLFHLYTCASIDQLLSYYIHSRSILIRNLISELPISHSWIMETLGLTSTEIKTAIENVLRKSGLAGEQLEDCRLYLEGIIRGNSNLNFHSFATSNVDEKELDSLVCSVKNALVKVMNKRLEGGRKFVNASELGKFFGLLVILR